MKVYNSQTGTDLTDELSVFLSEYRKSRNFNVESYLARKISLLNQYLKQSKITTCVVGLSGGVDSAVALALIKAASQKSDSYIKNIVPVLLPVFADPGATNQAQAIKKATDVCESLKIKPFIIDLTATHKIMSDAVAASLGITSDGWAAGQLVSYIRTPALYFATSLFASKNQPAIVIGTTNFDEGGYLGYFGKSSDGMVDLQLISDLHKSEVYKLAAWFNLPLSVISAIPTGDMFDNRNDEEVFGTSYDFVELYLHFLQQSKNNQQKTINKLSKISKDRFSELSGRLEKLHQYNAHKYLAKSPAIHIDILPAQIPGGWQNINPLIKNQNS